MKFSNYNLNRVRNVNSQAICLENDYVLYWMQAYRSLHYNHALNYALSLAKNYQKELIIYEGLRMDYPWNSRRIHQFILQGMTDNHREAERLQFNYWCFVETPQNLARGLLKKLSQNAVAIITDDFPAFIIPKQTDKLAGKIDCALFSVDSNGLIPLALYQKPATVARSVRIEMHRLFSEAYIHLPTKLRKNTTQKTDKIPPPFTTFLPTPANIQKILQSIPFNHSVEPVVGVVGGRKQADKRLKNFINQKLAFYHEKRSQPDHPAKVAVSGLSPYLHFGYIHAGEIVQSILNSNHPQKKWAPDLLNFAMSGKREQFFHQQEAINAFLDELLTWRDLGYIHFFRKREFAKGLEILPDWVQQNNRLHQKDKREYIYPLEPLETYQTHDPLWNAAQKELVTTGTMHNYMRMLWAKKVIEWTPSYQHAFEILEHLNNKYAYDGRNPNSYTGILWSFGAFDRPWFPERPILGKVRYMSSDSARKKFKMQGYLDYVDGQTLLS